MVGCQRMQFLYIFMPFSKTFEREFFKSPHQILVPYVKVGSIKALDKWDLSSQCVTPIVAYFPSGGCQGFYTHNITKQLHDGLFPKERDYNQNSNKNSTFVEKFIKHKLCAPHKREIPKVKANYAQFIHGPTELSQRLV